MNIPMPMPMDAANMGSERFTFGGKTSSEGDFLNLLTSLLAKGTEGENALMTLLKSGSIENNRESLINSISNEEDSLNSLISSLEDLGKGSTTVESLMKILNLKINGENNSFKRENFIIDDGGVEDILSKLKGLSSNASESLSQYINGINEENGFLQQKAMNSLNLQAQNSNIASTLQGMILNYSSGSENKEVLNALKYLQQFTTEEGSLDTGKLLKALEGKGKNQDNSSLMNMNLMQNHASGEVNGITTKEVNIFSNKDIVDVVVENFKTLRLPGRCEMTIKLNPKELGEITIKLVLEKGQISAAVTANKRETVAILQSNINTLMDQLKESGTDIQHIAINLSQEQNGEEARRGYKREDENQEDDEFENIFDDISEENEFINSLI